MQVEPLHLCSVTAPGGVAPVYAWLVRRVDGNVLIDTGMIDSTPQIDAEWAPKLHAWREIGDVVAVVNTHLHFDHCGGNRRFAGVPIHVQRAELDAARAGGGDYVSRWVFFEGADYVELDGESELLPGIRVLPTPGHSPGHQCVLVDADDGLVVLGGDVTYRMRELIRGDDEHLRRIRALDPARVYLSHASRPWIPGVRSS